MKDKRLLLHIGLHKTGTTSIQGTLKQSRAELERKGICYLPIGFGKTTREYYGHHNLSWQLLGNPRHNPAVPGWKEVAAFIKKSPHQNFIISSEAFEHCREDHLAPILPLLEPFDVSVMVFLRNQVDLIQSRFFERADRFFTEEPVAWVRSEIDSIRQRYHEILEPWAGAFGREKIQTRIFEQTQSTLANSLLDFFGPEALLENPPTKRLNTARGLEMIGTNIALSRILQGHLDERNYNLEIATALNTAAEQTGLHRHDEDIIDQALAEEILTRSAEQNQAIVRDYTPLPECYFKARTMNPVPFTETRRSTLILLAGSILQQRIRLHEERARSADQAGQPVRAKKIQAKIRLLRKAVAALAR